MRKVLALTGLILAGLASTPVLACVGPLPYDWHNVPKVDGEAIVIGRVLSVQPDGQDERYEYAIAEIETLEILQGQPSQRFTVRGVTALRPTQDIILWCGRYLEDQAGDIVMAQESAPGRYGLMMSHQISPPYLARMEHYRPNSQADEGTDLGGQRP